jgi:TetR/AcrR family transcriptional repressor of mexJK operon
MPHNKTVRFSLILNINRDTVPVKTTSFALIDPRPRVWNNLNKQNRARRCYSDPMANLSPREAAKRKQILTAARSLFLNRGYAGTSMDLVTSEAGISKQTLYRYYATKESLFSDLLSQVIHELTDEKQPLLASLPLPENREQLYDILLMMARVIAAKLNDPLYLSILRIVFSESVRFPEISKLLLESFPKSTGVLTDLLKRCGQTGLVKLEDGDVEMSMRMFVGPLIAHAVFGGLLSGAVAPEPMPEEELKRLCRIYAASIT